ncbi:MAG: hypothetical protein A2X35_08845 [Elusimicrobia bacterium GWA2_61_42]|nr:MAG: hypothetical protein A2X35_08845 [Elusimicrobia bacterium GWA2_61_42]OGR75603.1 MAG: hypothetical protein A2X38_12935 [Elusimicrobia bacterium GWC2_61_25]
MKKNLILAFSLAACCAAPAAAQEQLSVDARLIGGGSFSDPAFQDFIETSYGYLNSKNTMKVRTDFSDFRDAPISAVPTLKNPVPAAVKAAPAVPKKEEPALPAGHYKVTFAGESGPVGSFVWPLGDGSKKYAREYVFMSVTPAEKDYSKLLPRLETECGFRFAGEKTFYSRTYKRTVILGWAPAVNLVKIARLKGVLKAAVEKKSAGVPLKTKVRFTLKVPYQNRPNEFVPEFIKSLTEHGGFSAEAWFRLPQKGVDSKFSVFGVTGSLPVDMIGELSRSPFVAAVEFHDASL